MYSFMADLPRLSLYVEVPDLQASTHPRVCRRRDRILWRTWVRVITRGYSGRLMSRVLTLSPNALGEWENYGNMEIELFCHSTC